MPNGANRNLAFYTKFNRDLFEFLRRRPDVDLESLEHATGEKTYPLDKARNNTRIHNRSGDRIFVMSATGYAYIRFNSISGSKYLIRAGGRMSYPFKKIFLTNEAQPGKQISIIIGYEAFIEFASPYSTIKMLNAASIEISPATEDKQDSMISQVLKKGDVQPTDFTQKDAVMVNTIPTLILTQNSARKRFYLVHVGDSVIYLGNSLVTLGKGIPFYPQDIMGEENLPVTASLYGIALPSGAFVEIDYMEYASDALAQAAYVSNKSIRTGLQLWSKLNAAGDVTSPQIGTGGSVTGSPTYPVAKFGNGIFSNADANYATLPRVANSIDFSKGTIECWIKPNFGPTDGDYHNIWDFLGPGGDRSGIYLVFDSDQDKWRILVFENNAFKTDVNSGDFSWAANDLIHIGVSWDREGNDLGDSKTLIMKINNVEKGSSTTVWGTAGTQNANLHIGVTGSAIHHSDTVIDNLKSYNICKTDFSELNFESGYVLQCFSEATIKQQGSYALKVIAGVTEALNKTLTRTVTPTLDLSGEKAVKLSIRASRLDQNIKIGFHDSGGVTTEFTPDIKVINTWQAEEYDISAVADADKDVIDQIIVTILNASAENIFYLDNLRAPVEIPQEIRVLEET